MVQRLPSRSHCAPTGRFGASHSPAVQVPKPSKHRPQQNSPSGSVAAGRAKIRTRWAAAEIVQHLDVPRPVDRDGGVRWIGAYREQREQREAPKKSCHHRIPPWLSDACEPRAPISGEAVKSTGFCARPGGPTRPPPRQFTGA
jgi:hypothetical protein